MPADPPARDRSHGDRLGGSLVLQDASREGEQVQTSGECPRGGDTIPETRVTPGKAARPSSLALVGPSPRADPRA